MPRNLAVRDVMTADVVSFGPDDDVSEAMRTLVDRGIDGAPVVDAAREVIGVITTGDLIVKQSRLHWPTVVAIFGASLEFKPRGFEDNLEKALGSKVSDVMSKPAITIEAGASVEDAATIMSDKRVSRLPVVEGGRLAGIVSRVDILRGVLAAG
jgi:CBS domain-containing protein